MITAGCIYGESNENLDREIGDGGKARSDARPRIVSFLVVHTHVDSNRYR